MRQPCLYQAEVLGYGEQSVSSGASWRTDATTGYVWPDEYFTRINYARHGALADIKVPWELSRLQGLVRMAEICHSSDTMSEAEAAADQVAAVLRHWATNNRPGFGPNWAIAMEVAIRAVNVAVAVALAWDHWDEETRRFGLELLGHHQKYLARFPEISDVPGNHYLIGEMGRYFLEHVVLAVPLKPESGEAFAALVEAQFESDGIHLEHAPFYHRLCTEAVAWGHLAASISHAPEAKRLHDVLDRAVVALERLKVSDVELPVLGDSDSGQIVGRGTCDASTAYLESLLGRKRNSPAYCEAGQPLSLPPARNHSGVTRCGPFVRLAVEGFTVVVRLGPHGLQGRASHDHDDNGSPWITLRAIPLVVDHGCFSYTRDVSRRRADIGSHAHNHVLVAGHERFLAQPGSISPTVATAPLATERSTASALAWEVEWEDGNIGRVVHSRTLAPLGAGVLTVSDRICLQRPSRATLLWHLAPGWTAKHAGDAFVCTHPKEGVVVLAISAAVRGVPSECESVISPGARAFVYGRTEVGSTLQLTTSASEEVTFISRFSADGATRCS